MATKTITIKEGITLKVTMYNSSVFKPWLGKHSKYYHKVVVTNTDGDKAYFTFHDNSSTAKEKDLTFVLQCIFDDAVCGNMCFDEFGAELGYDYDNLANWRNGYNCCVHTLNSLNRLGVSTDDVYECYNILSNMVV